MSAEMLRSLRLQRLVEFSDKRLCLQGCWEVHALQRLIRDNSESQSADKLNVHALQRPIEVNSKRQ
jgi:hypothetical protein